jgi:hypothetical protein
MRPLSILYALFCMGVIALFIMAAQRRYSPFADGGVRTFAAVPRGPNHK